MLDNISLKGKERKGERGHSILLRARDSRARKEKKKEKLELRIMLPYVICIQFALTL